MPAVAPQLMTRHQFRQATDAFGRRRGLLLKAIDDQIQAWNNGQCQGARKRNLIRILHASRHWLQAKNGKTTTLCTRRRQAVNRLMQQAWARLQYHHFETHKAQGQHGGLRGLQGGYAHERSTYVNSGKQRALPGSSVHQILGFAQQLQIPNPPDFNTMNQQQFVTLIRDYADVNLFPSEVAFFDKQTRIGRAAVPWGGRLHGSDGSRLDTGIELYAYVINEYGVLITAHAQGEESALPTTSRFNHSSLNAGKTVVCAGILQAQRGWLTHIDNASGHYKPRRSDVAAGLRALADDDYDFGGGPQPCEVRIMEPVQNNLQWSIYDDARTLLANPNAQPDRVG